MYNSNNYQNKEVQHTKIQSLEKNNQLFFQILKMFFFFSF